jgi:hypothetical protein
MMYANNNNTYLNPLSSTDPIDPFRMSNAVYGMSTVHNYNVQPSIRYSRYIGKGTLNVLMAADYKKFTTKSNTSMAYNFANDNLMRSINNAEMVHTTESFAEHKHIGVTSTITYDYESKYVVNIRLRRDGSSRFGTGKRFGNFGSGSINWIASEETWMKNFMPTWLSFVKLKATYGITGSDDVGDYQYLSRWSVLANDNFSKRAPYGGVQSMVSIIPFNQEYQWQSNSTWDFSLEMSFFKDRLNLFLTHYIRTSGKQLTSIPTPDITGFETVLGNWAALVQNKGFEMEANGTIIDKKDFKLRSRLIFSLNRNKLLEFPGIEQSPYATIYKVGESLNTKYYLHYTGVDPASGLHTFEDRNKDGSIDGYGTYIPGDPRSDRYIPITLVQKYFGSFGLDLFWKDFSFSIDMPFARQLGNHPFMTRAPGAMHNLWLPDEVKNNTWMKPGDKALYHRYTTHFNSHIADSDGAFTDASFIKLSRIGVAYRLPSKLAGKVGMKGCTFTGSINNLGYITSYQGIDPETQTSMGTPMTRTISGTIAINL